MWHRTSSQQEVVCVGCRVQRCSVSNSVVLAWFGNNNLTPEGAGVVYSVAARCCGARIHLIHLIHLCVRVFVSTRFDYSTSIVVNDASLYLASLLSLSLEPPLHRQRPDKNKDPRTYIRCSCCCCCCCCCCCSVNLHDSFKTELLLLLFAAVAAARVYTPCAGYRMAGMAQNLRSCWTRSWPQRSSLQAFVFHTFFAGQK